MTDHDAQDAVQGFFESILRRETFAKAEKTTGKLRQLLLRAFDNWCCQQWQKAAALKRGGRAEHVELTSFMDVSEAEQRFLKADVGGSIESLYNREWATALLERSLEALRLDYAQRGWQERYDLLVIPLLQREDSSQQKLAASAGITAGSLRVNLHRMRSHYRDKIERELATTLDTEDPKVIRAEMAELFKAFT
jgi:DNA-directed RNA polymerase specialized sigma24 family protein